MKSITTIAPASAPVAVHGKRQNSEQKQTFPFIFLSPLLARVNISSHLSGCCALDSKRQSSSYKSQQQNSQFVLFHSVRTCYMCVRWRKTANQRRSFRCICASVAHLPPPRDSLLGPLLMEYHGNSQQQQQQQHKQQ